MRRLLLLPILLLGALLAAPATVHAHAVLVDSSPERGTAVTRSPERVVFRFNEPVETAFGSVRVFDAGGDRVDTGGAEHPGGDGEAVSVGLRPDLPDGSYTATYRVVSADSHPISGGFVFSVGEGAAAPAAAVAGLVDDGDAGAGTDVAFGAAKAMSYATIALALGGVLFVLAVWLPALRARAGATEAWRRASESFAERLRVIAWMTVGAGVTASAAGIVLQGATAAGTSPFEALTPNVISDVLSTRFGTVWGLRLVTWLVLGGLLALAGARAVLPVMRRASLGATGLAVSSATRPWPAVALVLPLGFLGLSPALAGHAGASDPGALLIPANTIHVLGMSVWIGGLALLLLALPAATARLDPPDRTRLLAACLYRFSPLALGAVIVLLATGTLQSVLHLSALSDLTDTAFGRAVLVKAGLIGLLIGLGAVNRRRTLPRMRRIAADGGSPGHEGRFLRSTLRTEVALLAVVLAVTAALTSYPPPDSLAQGPFTTTTDLGAARLELTVEPARVGANEIHLYLTDPRSGDQYDRLRDVKLALRLREDQIGPLEPRVDKAGPGHWVARRAQVAPAGDWDLTVSGRVSEFEEARTLVEVPFR